MIIAIGTLLGGIGLFLLGMLHLTDGLKQSAGEKLEHYLYAGTNTKTRGFVSGFTLTSLVQSSSVVTVATIGFANAGLLTMGQSAWVVFGSNVGTTMTGWIVALIGFKVKVEIFALPLVGIGAFLHILSKGTRSKAVGNSLAGFGLLFVGLDLLQSALAEHQGSFSFVEAGTFDVYHVVMFIGLGIVMTAVMQSSSASMAMILTLVNAGTVPLELGAAAVIGANVGTTSTALLATIGATPNAKRVAWAHVIFNLVAGTAALLLLPLVSEVFSEAYEQKLMGGNAAFWLAVYHSLFNVLGVLLMVPLEPKISHFLRKRFISEQREPLRLRYVDQTTLTMPPVAAQSILLELKNLHSMTISILQNTDKKLALKEVDQMERLLAKLDDFVIQLFRQPMADQLAHVLNLEIKCSQNLSNLLFMDRDICKSEKLDQDPKLLEIFAPLLDSYNLAIEHFREPYSKALSKDVSQLVSVADETNEKLLRHIKNASVSGADIQFAFNVLGHYKRIVKLLAKASRRIAEIEKLLRPSDIEETNNEDANIKEEAQYTPTDV